MNVIIGPDGRLRAGWRFFLSVGLYFVALTVAGTIAVSVLGRPGGGFDPRFDALFRPLLCGLMLTGFSFLALRVDQVVEPPLSTMGLGTERRWFCEASVGFLLGGLLIAGCVAAMAILGSLTLRIETDASALRYTLLLFWVLGLAALHEELLFRGYPFQRLVEWAGPTVAIVALSTLFGFAHLRNPAASAMGLVNTVLVGILFAIAFLRTGSLWFVWGLHFGWNFVLGVVFGLRVSGFEMSSVVRGEVQGSEWLTGGDYGVEASVTATFAIVFALVGVAYLGRRFSHRLATNPGASGIQSSREV